MDWLSIAVAFCVGIAVGALTIITADFESGRFKRDAPAPKDAAPFKVGDHVLLNEYDLEPRRVHGVRRESMVGWQVFVKLTTKFAWLPARNVVKAPRETTP